MTQKAKILVVDPIFRGSRLFYSWMAWDAYKRAGFEPVVVTRRDYDTPQLAEFFKQPITPVADLVLPDGFWYGKLTVEQIETLVDSVLKTAAGDDRVHVHFSGLNEVFPEILQVLAAKAGADAGRLTFSFVEYDARFVVAPTSNWAPKADAIKAFMKVFPDSRFFLLDDRFETVTQSDATKGLVFLPDPAPMEADEIAAAQAASAKSKLWVDSDRLRIVGVGRQNKRKGLTDVIRASRLIDGIADGIGVYLSGPLDDSDADKRGELTALNNARRLHWRDEYVAEDEIRRVYRDSDYVMMPYDKSFEGSSGVFAYAAAFGKPMIGTDHGVVGHRIREHGLGFVYPAGDGRELSDLLISLPRPGTPEYDRLAANVQTYFSTHNIDIFRKTLVGETTRTIEAKVTTTKTTAEPVAASTATVVSAVPAAPVPLPVPASAEPVARNIQKAIEDLLGQPGGVEYKQILLLDTSVASKNMGDHIIMDSVRRLLRFFFPHALFVNVPTHEYMGTEGLKLLAQADHAFVCGTNLLCSNADDYKQWKLRGSDAFVLSNLTLLGVGWWQYQDAANPYTAFLYNQILSKTGFHSTRDGYTQAKLDEMGISKVINTCCPTTWFLTRRHQARLPKERQDKAVFTFTDYNKNAARDGAVLKTLLKMYKEVYVWLQGTGDFAYAKELGIPGIRFIAPTVDAYDEFLTSTPCDYIGTRLHAGIRALQKGRNALILAVDNRALEIARDVNLPVIARDDAKAFEEAMAAPWNINIRVPYDRIATWGRQFGLPASFDLEYMLDHALYGDVSSPQVEQDQQVKGTIYLASQYRSDTYAHYYTTFYDFEDGISMSLKLFRYGDMSGFEFRPKENSAKDSSAFFKQMNTGMPFQTDENGEFIRVFANSKTKQLSAGGGLKGVTPSFVGKINRLLDAIRDLKSPASIELAKNMSDQPAAFQFLNEVAAAFEEVPLPMPGLEAA
jgi:glycosyltransferase involved in cell wall biosynthesis/polysaccharide pyruvyl transferase WcaK-like protein